MISCKSTNKGFQGLQQIRNHEHRCVRVLPELNRKVIAPKWLERPLYRGSIGENKLGDFLFFSLIFYCIFWGFGVLIIPKWLIEVPGHIPILFGWFRELRTFCQNRDPEPSPTMGEMYLNNIFNCFIDFSASFWYNKIPISLF